MIAPDVQRIALALIRRDGGTQIRAQLSMDVAKDYAEAMARGDKFPPAKARYDGTDYWLSDGFHRHMAAELVGAVAMDLEVRPGTRRDAILDAVGANAAHGYRRTNADKRRAVMTLIEDDEWSKKSDRQLARIAHVDHGMVSRLRPKPSGDERQMPVEREVKRGDQTFKMRIDLINSDREQPPAQPEEATEPLLVKGSRQLRTFLGELRAGADADSAAVVAEISPGEAREHAKAEERGEYSDVAAIRPNWSIEVVETPEPAAEAPEPAAPEPPAFDFDAAKQRDAIMAAISTLAAAPAPADFAAAWSAHVGRGVPAEIVQRGRAWLAAFADLFPAAEERRQQAVAAMMEKL
jgi:hypothetical protein